MKRVIIFLALVLISLSSKGQSIAVERTGWTYYAQGMLTGGGSINIKPFSAVNVSLDHYLYEHRIYKPWGLYASIGYSPGAYPDLFYTVEGLGYYVSLLYSIKIRAYDVGISRYGTWYHGRFRWGIGAYLVMSKVSRMYEDVTDCRFTYKEVYPVPFDYCAMIQVNPGWKVEPMLRGSVGITLAKYFHIYAFYQAKYGFSDYAAWKFHIRQDKEVVKTLEVRINGTGITSGIGIKADLVDLMK